MIDVEKFARKALTLIKLKWGLPPIGFITGGSIGNMIWELVSGNEAVINDIDVFIYNKISNDENIFKYQKVEVEYTDAYNQLISSHNKRDGIYKIKESINKGIFNEVRYESDNTSPSLIIDSFDINCTRIGYSIEEDKFYWTKDFEEFLNTGELKIANLNTPAHTAIRIIKKKHELKAKLSDAEFAICQYTLLNRNEFMDISRFRFKQRYASIYEKYSEKLNKFFTIKHDEGLENYLVKNKLIFDSIYYLEVNSDNDFIDISSNFRGSVNYRLTNSEDFLFYIRNIYKNKSLQEIYQKLYFYYNSIDYIDVKINFTDVEFLSKISKLYPGCVRNLQGLKFSEQIKLINDVIKNVTKYHDYETAIAVLENVKLNKGLVFDEDECLVLGLSVRKLVKLDCSSLVELF